MKALWRHKKGQMQGVDFALAMIIFMILFAEVIVLTLSFITPKFQNLSNKTFYSTSQQIADTFFTGAGYPSNWEYIYDSPFSSFGLKQIGSTNLDANKISRLNPKGLYNIPYENLRGNFSEDEDIGFQFRIESLFDVNSTLSLTKPLAQIFVQTSIGDCIIWCFVVNPSSVVIYEGRATTNSTGGYQTTFFIGSGILPSGFFTLVVFARTTEENYAIDFKSITVDETETDLKLKQIFQESQTNNGEGVLQTTNDGTLNSLSALILHPFLVGEEKLGNQSITRGAPSASETFNLRVPTNGTCVTLLTGTTALGNFSRKIFVYPSQLCSKFITIYGVNELPTNRDLVKFEKIVNIRECIFKVVLYIWPE